jgi:hypothetical protein
VNLQNDPLTGTDVIIRFTWEDGASDGGANILSYDVYYDLGSASPFELLEAGISTQYYTTSITLTPGTTYGFKVLATNSVGQSELSEPV